MPFCSEHLKARFRRSTSHEPNRIQWIKFMWSAGVLFNSKWLIEFGSAQMFFTIGSAKSTGCGTALIQTPIDSDADLHIAELNAKIILIYFLIISKTIVCAREQIQGIKNCGFRSSEKRPPWYTASKLKCIHFIIFFFLRVWITCEYYICELTWILQLSFFPKLCLIRGI